jgi:hypothetical protein
MAGKTRRKSNTDYDVSSIRTLSICAIAKEYVAVSQLNCMRSNARMKREKENVRRVVVVQRVEHRLRHLFKLEPCQGQEEYVAVSQRPVKGTSLCRNSIEGSTPA